MASEKNLSPSTISQYFWKYRPSCLTSLLPRDISIPSHWLGGVKFIFQQKDFNW